VSTSANASYATLLRSGPNAILSQSQSGKILATAGFISALGMSRRRARGGEVPQGILGVSG